VIYIKKTHKSEKVIKSLPETLNVKYRILFLSYNRSNNGCKCQTYQKNYGQFDGTKKFNYSFHIFLLYPIKDFLEMEKTHIWLFTIYKP